MNIQQLLKALEQIGFALAILTAVCYFYQIVYLFLPFLIRRKPHAPAARTRYAVLIAARNEERVLPHLLDSLRAQDYPSELFEVFVVADNCTDRTAAVAREHGATVFERFNTEQVGKGYALNFLLGQIDSHGGLSGFDAFLIFDADNLLKSDYITQINRVCSDGYEAFCGYRNTKNFGGNWLSSGYGIWYLHDSTHLNQSRMLIGTSCAVSGTGFGFTRQLLERIGGWHFFTLTEDIEFNTWCATNGVRIGYCHDAICYDEQPTDFVQSWRQRTRWTQGGLQVFGKYGLAMLRGITKGGMTSYASFETATLSVWGYGMSLLTGGIAFLSILLAKDYIGLLSALALSLLTSYLSLFAIGALAMATEWDRVPATRAQKWRAMFTFPLFMFTFLPISATAIFRKFQWQPITHSVAISTRELSQ